MVPTMKHGPCRYRTLSIVQSTTPVSPTLNFQRNSKYWWFGRWRRREAVDRGRAEAERQHDLFRTGF